MDEAAPDTQTYRRRRLFLTNPPERLLMDVVPETTEYITRTGITFERHSDIECLEQFDVPQTLGRINWLNILKWGGHTYLSLAKGMYGANCSVNRDRPSFTISFTDGSQVQITPSHISSLNGVPLCPGGLKSIDDSVPDSERLWVTEKLCGVFVEWIGGNALRASEFLPKFRLLHQVFLFNVYPRKGNRGDLTPLMINTLIAVDAKQNIYLTSIICRTIIDHWSCKGHSAAPFGYLMSELAKKLGVPIPDEETVHHNPLNRTSLHPLLKHPLL